jgi:hypothetical protein
MSILARANILLDYLLMQVYGAPIMNRLATDKRTAVIAALVPAMEVGLTDRVWSVEELLALLEKEN